MAKISKWGPWATGALLAVGALIIAANIMPAFATVATPVEDTGLRVNLQEYVVWLGTVVVGGASWLVARGVGLLPGPARWAIKLTQIDQILNAAIRAWADKNVPLIADKAIWTVDLKNTAVRDMVEIALNTGNKYVKEARNTLPDKLHARLDKYIRDNYGPGVG